ncbi:MAG: DUF2914 domain-containing protein [Thermodesulfobacteriota bacterium]
MRRRKMMLLLTAMVILACVMIPQAYGQEKAKEGTSLTIARLVVGTGVENSEPVGAAETFPASTEKVYCSLEATNIAKDTEVTFLWSYGGKEMLKTTLPLKAGPRWRTYGNKNLRGLKGDWKVEIKDSEGKVLKDIKFKVQ